MEKGEGQLRFSTLPPFLFALAYEVSVLQR